MIKGVTEKSSSGKFWAGIPNLNIQDNILFIADNENVFNHLSWLGYIRVICQKPPNLEVFRSCLEFFY